MKKLFLTLLGLALYSGTFAQFNYFFPDSNSYFSVSWMKFWFEGDTSIGDFTYKKVYVQSHDSIADFSKARYFAALREDTIAEKVYFRYVDYNGNAEFLLYDFSVNIGDTVSFYSLWPFWYPELKQRVVESIDSTLIDNHYRKRINFHQYYQPESWIEGIGSTNGIFFPGYFDIADAMEHTYLLCAHIDGELIYPLNSPDICYTSGSGVRMNEHKNEPLKIYPTIADNLLYIETDKSINGFDYKIINVQGQVMNIGTLTSNTINVSNLNKGIYLIMIADNNKIITRQGFIKH
jgi:hypothetical protein